MDFTKFTESDLIEARDYLRGTNGAIRPPAVRSLELCFAEHIASWPTGLDLADHSLSGRQRVITHLSKMVRSDTYSCAGRRSALARAWKKEQSELSRLWVRETATPQTIWFDELRAALAPSTPALAAA